MGVAIATVRLVAAAAYYPKISSSEWRSIQHRTGTRDDAIAKPSIMDLESRVFRDWCILWYR
jgi:hypothetical protein